jgi:hypothetical protein
VKTVKIFAVYFSLVFISLGASDKARQTSLEQNLMAPCCGGGVIYDHADNQKTALMKEIIAALIDPHFEKSTVQSLFQQTYSGPGMYQFGYAPAKKNLEEITDYVGKIVKAGMSDREILDIFGWIHNEKILAIPKAEGFNLTAWIMPAVVFVLGVLIMILYFTNGPTKVALTQQKQNIRHSDQIEQELMEMD